MFTKYVTKTSFQEAIEDNITNLKGEILKTLEDMALNGKLKPIVYGETHLTHFSNAWNLFIQQEISTTKDEEHLMSSIDYFVEKLIHYNASIKNGEDLEQRFTSFITFLNQGDFRTFCTPEGECTHCGTSLKIKFKNWEPTFYEWKEISDPKDYRNKVPVGSKISFLNKMDYFPADTCFENFLNVKDVEFKTGELIITDWIRLKEFTEIVEPNGNIYHFNPNHAKGRSDAFNHYFEQGVISIPGSAGLDIYSLKNEGMNDCLFFGKMDYLDDNFDDGLDSSKFTFEKQTNRGLRATTIIEKDVLIELLMKTTKDKTQAVILVDDYLEKNKPEIIRRNVTPGIYTLIFDLRTKDLSDLLFPQNIAENFHSNIFLYPKSLTPSLKPTSKKPKF